MERDQCDKCVKRAQFPRLLTAHIKRDNEKYPDPFQKLFLRIVGLLICLKKLYLYV